MNELEKLQAKPKKIKLQTDDGEVEVNVYPLTADDADLIAKLEMKEEVGATLKELAYRTLERAFPNTNRDEFKRINLKTMNKIIAEVLKASGLEDTKKKVVDQQVA